MMNRIAWRTPVPVLNALDTAFTHAHETLLWESKGHSARHTFTYYLTNDPDSRA